MLFGAESLQVYAGRYYLPSYGDDIIAHMANRGKLQHVIDGGSGGAINSAYDTLLTTYVESWRRAKETEHDIDPIASQEIGRMPLIAFWVGTGVVDVPSFWHACAASTSSARTTFRQKIAKDFVLARQRSDAKPYSQPPVLAVDFVREAQGWSASGLDPLTTSFFEQFADQFRSSPARPPDLKLPLRLSPEESVLERLLRRWSTSAHPFRLLEQKAIVPELATKLIDAWLAGQRMDWFAM